MKYLFVGGPQRSGTTAFAQVLNEHPRIFLGLERYKNLYINNPQDITPQLFEEERFFRVDPSETNVGLDDYQAMNIVRQKFRDATYRGDKRPRMMQFRRVIAEQIPGARFIVLYRDPFEICSSWNKRAHDERDKWPIEDDCRAAVSGINEEMRLAVHYNQKRPESYIIVKYERVFGPQGQEVMQTILNILGLENDPNFISALDAYIAKAQELKAKREMMLAGHEKFIEENINWELMETAVKLSI